MKRIIIIATIVLLLITTNSYAAYSGSSTSCFDGDGSAAYPNSGYIYVTMSSSGSEGSHTVNSITYSTGGNLVNYKWAGCVYAYRGDCTMGSAELKRRVSSGSTYQYAIAAPGVWNSITDCNNYTANNNNNNWGIQGITATGGCADGSSSSANVGGSLAISTGAIYNLLGDTVCLSGDVELYTLDILISTYTIAENAYHFDNIIDGFEYKVKFPDGAYYNFTCDGNEIYDYDACAHYTLNLLDNCANLLIEPTTTIFRDMTEVIYQGSDNPIELIIGSDVNESDYLQIIIDTCDGAVQYFDYASEIEKDLYHPNIAWNLDVHVIDDNTDADISGVKVTRSQPCTIIEPSTAYALTQANGHVIFIGLANSNVALQVEKEGYNTYNGVMYVGDAFNCRSDGGSVTISMNATTGDSTDDFNNGTHDDSTADGEGEETLPNDHPWGCGVYFKNTDGHVVGSIDDTDAYVDMYYWNKCGCDVALKFQHQTYTYWYTDVEYTMSNNTYEYRRILNTNFSDHTNSYRGYIYNATCECNNIQILRVLNQTYEEETHYENLTSHCWIWDKLSGNEIDYRSDIKCVIYANSTNSTLLNITANFMNQSTFVDSKILNWADFVTGSPKWYYVWYPNYEYTTGYNYTLNITGFDDYQLDTDEVWTSDIIGNTLNVYVRDNHDNLLSYSTVFIENWGSIATGSSTYARVHGLPDGDIQYKATKSGYISSGWNTVTLDGADDYVTCILIEIESTTVLGQKMSDEDIKSIFIPMMYILFIFMILGAFMYANE